MTLSELAKRVGMTPRAIRHLIERKLLRGSGTRGAGARYTNYHLERILAIRNLKEGQGFGFADVARYLESLSPKEIHGLAEEWSQGRGVAGVVPPVTSSALDYLNTIRSEEQPAEKVSPVSGPPILPKPLIRSARSQRPTWDEQDRKPVEQLIHVLSKAGGVVASPPQARGEAWFRIEVTPNVELSIRGYDDPAQLAAFERLADLIRNFLMGVSEDERNK